MKKGSTEKLTFTKIRRDLLSTNDKENVGFASVHKRIKLQSPKQFELNVEPPKQISRETSIVKEGKKDIRLAPHEKKNHKRQLSQNTIFQKVQIRKQNFTSEEILSKFINELNSFKNNRISFSTFIKQNPPLKEQKKYPEKYLIKPKLQKCIQNIKRQHQSVQRFYNYQYTQHEEIYQKFLQEINDEREKIQQFLLYEKQKSKQLYYQRVNNIKKIMNELQKFEKSIEKHNQMMQRQELELLYDKKSKIFEKYAKEIEQMNLKLFKTINFEHKSNEFKKYIEIEWEFNERSLNKEYTCIKVMKSNPQIPPFIQCDQS